MKLRMSLIVATVIYVVASIVASSPADAATTPSVTVQPLAGFSVPGHIYLDSHSDPGGTDWDASFLATWTVSAPAGVCAQTITETSYDTYPGSQTTTLPNSARSYNFSVYWMDQYRVATEFQINVTDCNGVTATSDPIGISEGVSGHEDTDVGSVTYSGHWATSKCACFSDGTVHYSTAKGASAVVTVQASYTGEPIALVMAKAPNRGSATIYLDGVKKTVVNLYSNTKDNDSTVWTNRVKTGRHVIAVVNNGTPGHSRIDFDLLADEV